MQIVFRVDASLQIGSGHVVRCITLAKALRNQGVSCRFFVRAHPHNLLELICLEKFDVVVLPFNNGDYNDFAHGEENSFYSPWLGVGWKTDALETIDALSGTRPDWLIVDHYALDARWEALLREHVDKIMVIDDLANRNHHCDLLLDQNLTVNEQSRYDGLLPQTCARLIGPRYALLQNEYAELHPRTPARKGAINRILIYFGGADVNNITGLALSAFLSLNRKDISVDVVISSSNPNAGAIQEMALGNSRIVIHRSLPSLAGLMLKADLAIGAGGATSWERCCLGLPSLIITLAENQIPIATALDEYGYAQWLGHFGGISQQAIAQAVQTALADVSYEQRSEKCMELVDANGVDRVTSIMLLDDNSTLDARLADPSDEAFVLQHVDELWPGRNNKQSNRNLFYYYLRNLDAYRIYIIETGHGMPIGIVLFQKIETEWKIIQAASQETSRWNLASKMFVSAVLAFRKTISGVLEFGALANNRVDGGLQPEQKVEETNACPGSSSLSIAICSDHNSWFNETVPELIWKWLRSGNQCSWSHDANELSGGDLCFYLSYGRIVGPDIRGKYRNNLVVHASDLPKGRGWSPASWSILEEATRIPVTLIEAEHEVDSGVIYDQVWFDLAADDLIDDWRCKLSTTTSTLVLGFVDEYPNSIKGGRDQVGDPKFLSQEASKRQSTGY